jgi:hypothetical protein
MVCSQKETFFAFIVFNYDKATFKGQSMHVYSVFVPLFVADVA